MKTLSCAGTVVKLRITLVRPSSRNHFPPLHLREGFSGTSFFFFFFRMILVSRGSMGSFWVVHLVSSMSAWYAFFAPVWWIQGAMSATLTAVGVVKTTVHEPFYWGASVSCFQSFSHTWSPGINSCICSPKGNSIFSCTNLVTWLITLPSCSICCDIPFPLTWSISVVTCLIMGGGLPYIS